MKVLSKSYQGKEQEEGRSRGEIQWKLSEVNTKPVPRLQNELIDEFKMAADDVISIRG
jgi:hypothetical protein